MYLQVTCDFHQYINERSVNKPVNAEQSQNFKSKFMGFNYTFYMPLLDTV